MAALLVACYCLFFHHLGQRDLWSSHEARAGMDAQSLMEGGSWGMPHLFDGQPELQKPPLYYWLVALIGRIYGGVDSWVVRLPSAVAALGCVLALVGGIGVLRRRRGAGFAAAAILATAVHFVWLARIARIDMPLTLTVTISAGSFYLARRRSHDGRPNRLLLAVGYLAMVPGLLLKGPIGAVLPAAIVLAHLGLEGDLRARRIVTAIRSLGLAWGVPLVLTLALPWFLWAHAATSGEFTRVFFWHHNFGRGLGGTGLRANPWWFYLPQFAGDFFPWSVLLVPAAWGSRHWLRRDPDARFGLAWFGAVVLLLSLARFKRADYLLPAYPGAALFLGCALCRWSRRRSWRFADAVVPGVVGAVALGWLVRVDWLLLRQEAYRDYRAFAAEVRRRAPLPQPVALFQTEAHTLAFHVGRPLAVLVQWQQLRAWAAQSGSHYVVMPPESATAVADRLPGVPVEEVLRNTDLSSGQHERPLVLLRVGSAVACTNNPFPTTTDARAAEVETDCQRTAQRGPPGP
jgi:4-amino-4-deoxy-L-arabinose transferase-like glycosyltransferase